ncbi:MAG: hypothetical protein HYZ53_25730 [Planctomycetes bacterium]|nr:hypothetical protein [Planctomycetota bacterium]
MAAAPVAGPIAGQEPRAPSVEARFRQVVERLAAAPPFADEELVEQAVAELTALAEPAPALCFGLLDDPRPPVRELVARYFEKVDARPDGLAGALLRRVQADEFWIAAPAARALARTGASAAVPQLMTLLDPGTGSQVAAAAEGLARCGKDAIQPLFDWMDRDGDLWPAVTVLSGIDAARPALAERLAVPADALEFVPALRTPVVLPGATVAFELQVANRSPRTLLLQHDGVAAEVGSGQGWILRTLPLKHPFPVDVGRVNRMARGGGRRRGGLLQPVHGYQRLLPGGSFVLPGEFKLRDEKPGFVTLEGRWENRTRRLLSSWDPPVPLSDVPRLLWSGEFPLAVLPSEVVTGPLPLGVSHAALHATPEEVRVRAGEDVPVMLEVEAAGGALLPLCDAAAGADNRASLWCWVQDKAGKLVAAEMLDHGHRRCPPGSVVIDLEDLDAGTALLVARPGSRCVLPPARPKWRLPSGDFRATFVLTRSYRGGPSDDEPDGRTLHEHLVSNPVRVRVGP